MTTLSGDECALSEGMLLITDAKADKPIGIAGVKGGKVAEITETTTDIIIESANFDGTNIRRTAQTLKLFTDASLRFQNRPSPELAAYGMKGVLALIQEVAGGEIVWGCGRVSSKARNKIGSSYPCAHQRGSRGEFFEGGSCGCF